MSEERFMARAIELADKPLKSNLPNPRVGAVIVYRDEIVGEGLHKGPGTAHAEIAAIKNAWKKGFSKFHQAQIYVNLEPCCHTEKRTPACVPELARRNFKEVIIAHKDPNPKVNGKGIRLLKKHKIKVRTGLLADKAIQINQAFIKSQTTKMPYVRLKLAMTFDGKLALDNGDSQWITNEKSRKIVHELRAKSQAMAIGKGTIEKDNPKLNVRLGKKEIEKPAFIFGAPNNWQYAKVRKANGFDNVKIVEGSLPQILSELYQNEIYEIMLEGGARLASDFLGDGLVDRLDIFYGRGFIGGRGLYSLGQAWSLKSLDESASFRAVESTILDGDLYVVGEANVYRPDSKTRKS